MGYNKKVLSEATKKLDKPSKKKVTNNDLIPFVSNLGYKQGEPPAGTNYRIPSDTIYNPTPYNILAIASTGEERIIPAGDTTNQTFENAEYIDEYELKKGGQKRSTKKYSKSLSATNKLFDKNPLFKKPKSKKKKIFDPNANSYQGGGETDSWGRPSNSPWFGLDPESNKFTVKDQWGRSPGDPWYGFDPNRNVWTKGSKAQQATEKQQSQEERYKTLYEPLENKFYSSIESDDDFNKIPENTQNWLSHLFVPDDERNLPPVDPVLQEMQKKLLKLNDSEFIKLLQKDYGDINLTNFGSYLPSNVSYSEALKYIKHLKKLKGQGYTFQEGGVPEDYQAFLDYSATAPENRRPNPNYPDDYDHYGMWESLGKPKDFQQALEMNPDWQPDPYDGMYHGFSVNPYTGVFLKSGKPGLKEGDTTWMEIAGHYLGRDAQKYTPVFDVDLQRFRYIPNEQNGGNLSLPKLAKAQNGIIISDPKEYKYRKQMYNDSLALYNENAQWQPARNKALQELIDWTTKKGTVKKSDIHKIVIDNQSKKIKLPASYTDALQNRPDEANQWNNVNKKIKPSNVGRTYAANKKGEVVTDKYGIPLIFEYPIYKKPVQPIMSDSELEIGKLPIRKLPQVEIPELIENTRFPKPQKYEPIRTVKRMQTVMEPDPKRPGKYKVKDLRRVDYAANFPGEGWESLEAPRVVWINEKGEEVYEDPRNFASTDNMANAKTTEKTRLERTDNESATEKYVREKEEWRQKNLQSKQKYGGNILVSKLTKAQEGLEQPIIDKSRDEAEMFVFANAAAEKKHKQLMDKARSLMTTVRGREAWYQDVKPKDFTNKELSRFIQGAEDYRKQAEAFERARRKVKEGEISTTDFARMYEERDWSRFDPNVMREGYKGQFQNAVDEANARKEKNMAVTDTLLEFTGAPALKRIVEDPIGTAKGVGQTVADAAVLANPWIGQTMGAENPTINPITGETYGTGLDKTFDVISVAPFAGYLGVTDDLARASRYLTNKSPLKNIPRVQPTPSSSNAFKSEINWGKWNPDTPKYPELINEYNAIEESTKKAGTWMKNPDGSPFQGTPEQFIQQQSSYFKKAFGDDYVKGYHGSNKGNIQEFRDPKAKDLQDGVYMSSSRKDADSYGFKLNPNSKTYELAAKAENPLSIDVKNKLWSNISHKSLIDAIGEEKFKALDIKPRKKYNTAQITDIANKAGYDVVDFQNIRDAGLYAGFNGDILRGIYPPSIPHNYSVINPKNIKSLKGNVGFFDMNDPNIYRTIDFEDAPFLAPEKSYFAPKTDFEKELAAQAEEYFKLKTSPENFARARALDAESGTNYTKALQDLIEQKANQGVAEKFPFKIRIENSPDDGGGAYSALTPIGAAKKKAGVPTTIEDREIVIYGNSPIEDLRRRSQHEMSHHTILGQNDEEAFNNAWGEKLRNALETPGDISKINPQLAANLMEPAFPKMNNSPTLYEYISNPAEVDAYINTTFRDQLVQQGILKNHWDVLDDDKIALYLMSDAPKDRIVKTLLDIIKPSELLDIFNKGIYAIPALIGVGAASQSEYKDGGISMYLTQEEIKKYREGGYTVVYE